MDKYLENKCPNCDGKMVVSSNCIECPFCGTQYISIYAGSIDADVSTVDLETLINNINKNKKDFLIINGKVSTGDINDVIKESSLKIAENMLKNGDFSGAIQYSSGIDGIEATRITFLAAKHCKSEAFLQEKVLWNNLTCFEIPLSLKENEVYGAFYSSLFEFAKEREKAASESSILFSDYIGKYLFLDKRVKEASGKDIYEILRHRAVSLCSNYPVFPEPWFALKLFDSDAIRKMIGAFSSNAIPFNVLFNWTRNHITNLRLNAIHKDFIYKPILTKPEISLIENEMTERYRDKYLYSKKKRTDISTKQNIFVNNKNPSASYAVQIGGTDLVAYQKSVEEKATISFQHFIKKCGYTKNPHGYWAYAKNCVDSLPKGWEGVWWTPNKYFIRNIDFSSKYSHFVYGFPKNNMICENEKDAFIELLQNHFASFDFTLFDIEVVDVDFVYQNSSSVVRVFKLTALW